jgi:uncharacterized protein (DUF302 family)
MVKAHSSWFDFFWKATAILLVSSGLCTGVLAENQATPGMPFLPLPLPPSPLQAELSPNTMLPPVPREAKRSWAQLFMMFNPVGIRDLLNFMGHKIPAKKGLTVDEVVEALISRAEKHGFLLVNRYQMWKELQARTGEAEPYKVEVVSICDPLVSRDWLDYAPEMALFVPPRIAVVEDHDRRIWLIMLDWDMHWLDTARGTAFDAKLRVQGIERREMLEDVMQAAANGEK